MEIKGNYYNGFKEKRDCSIKVKSGIVVSVLLETKNHIERMVIKPEDDSVFDLIKVLSGDKNTSVPDAYKLKYKNEFKDEILLYIKPSPMELIRLKIQEKRSLFQDRRIHITIAAGVISILVFVVKKIL
jgi:hypothetical protein|tara:strand:+ start:1096 stop:1482 length:387 start_codon:yes stop_codon:yes gene_type:complete